MAGFGEPFIGSEALACGAVNRHRLRTQYRPLFPGVYLSKQVKPSLERRIAAAWLWSHRQAIIAGAAAAALHGARWVDDDVAVELIHPNPRTPPGVLAHRDAVLDAEVQMLAGRLVTTPERTAFDIGRRGPVRSAVAQLDALAQATGFKLDDVASIAQGHPRARGLRQLETVLDLVDAGAESPKESYLRLLLIGAGFPRPQTQIPVVTRNKTYYLDMGWTEHLVAVEYDGEHHRIDRRRYTEDVRRLETLQQMGWLVIRVVAGNRAADIVRRVRQALDTRRSAVR
jgi:very-short-patch-repair endonuclease